MKNWRKNLEAEFGIHFEDSAGELQFLQVFIEELRFSAWSYGFLTGATAAVILTLVFTASL